jgi:hypothetical protein
MRDVPLWQRIGAVSVAGPGHFAELNVSPENRRHP